MRSLSWLPVLGLLATALAMPLAAAGQECPDAATLALPGGIEAGLRKAGGQQGEYAQRCAGAGAAVPLPVCGKGARVDDLGRASAEALAGATCRTGVIVVY